jgi:hypothetical protein
MLAKMKSDREKIQAETGTIRAKTKAMRDKRMETNRESDQEELKGTMNATQERMDANTKDMNTKMDANHAKADGKQEEMLARIQENTQATREVIKSSQAEMRSTLYILL